MREWMKTHPREMFADEYELFVYRVFFKTTEEYLNAYKRKNIFSDTPSAKKQIENFFDIKF